MTYTQAIFLSLSVRHALIDASLQVHGFIVRDVCFEEILRFLHLLLPSSPPTLRLAVRIARSSRGTCCSLRILRSWSS